VKVAQAFRFALDPSPAQVRALYSHVGASRFAWNPAPGNGIRPGPPAGNLWLRHEF
jgi:hypothetical protein